jgi:hypothetical protein
VTVEEYVDVDIAERMTVDVLVTVDGRLGFTGGTYAVL